MGINLFQLFWPGAAIFVCLLQNKAPNKRRFLQATAKNAKIAVVSKSS